MANKFSNKARPYRYVFRPTSTRSSDDFSMEAIRSDRLYIEQQFRELSNVTQTQADAIIELQTGVSDGTKLTLPDLIETPGRFRNPIVTIDRKGRVIAIVEAPEPTSPIPDAPASDLVLTSGPGGTYAWKPLPSPFPSGGTAGQVLTRTATGFAWTTPATVPAAAPSLILRSLRDLDISDGAIAGDGIFEAELRPTGVVAGTYTNPTIQVDAKGRILVAQNGDTGSGDALRDGSYRFWRVTMPPKNLIAAPPVVGAVAFLEAIGGPDLGGIETRVPGSIARTFTDEHAVIALTVTVSSVADAPTQFVVEASQNGVAWFAIWEAGAKNWTAGETRTIRRKGTVTLTGAVTGTGEDEIVTTLSETGVEPGTYTNADVTVGADGRITAIENGTGGGGSIDPDTPLDYLTFTDQVTGDEIIATIESGAWVLTPAGIPMENGDTLTSENGSDTIAPEA